MNNKIINIEDLISQGVVELKMFDTKPEHAKEYGLDSVNPLYVQSLCITENKRLKGIGNKVLNYIDEYAIKNGHDVVFGHITQDANVEMIKNWLHSKGYAINNDNNDFYKVVNPDIRFVDGGKVDSFGKVVEVIINPTEINCHRCHWHWKVKDGGYDLFICHNCNYDNTKYYKFEGKEGERILAFIKYKKLDMKEKGGELAKGIKAEQEHSETIAKFKRKGVSVNDIAKSIALDHLKEDSKYYTKLEKMEKTKFADGGGVDVLKINSNNKYDIAILFDNTNDKYDIEKQKIIYLLNQYSVVIDKMYDMLYIKLDYSKNYKQLLKELSKIENKYQSVIDVVVFTKKYNGGRSIQEKDYFADGGGVAQVIDPNQQQVIYVDENGYLVEEDKGLIDKAKDKGKEALKFIKDNPELLMLSEGGAIDTITKLEIDAMKRSINDPNTSEYLKKTYNKILAKYDVDITKPYEGKYKEGKYIDTYDFSGYEYMKRENEEAGVSFLLTGEYQLVSKAIYEKDYSMWLFYNYLGRINISFQACKDWLNQATEYFVDETPVPINLTHTPNAKDGRSFALWFATTNFQTIKNKFGEEKIAKFEYNGVYYYQEIGMVGNFDANNSDGWGSLYKEKKTGLLIPEFTQTSFHFNTLIHEFSHCLDFQTQLLSNIDKYNLKQSQKAVSVVIDDNTTDLEKQLYGMSLESNDGNFVAHPITNHFEFFVDSLIKILRACASGKIPLTQLYEQQALDVQTTLSGVYGDLLLEQRERKRKEGVALKKQDELRANTRFTWQDKWVMDAKNYIIKNAQQQGLKESLNSKTSEFTLSEIIELDNLINRYIETEFRKYLAEQPTKAQSLVEPIKLMKKESNRIINNHYDNIKNKYEYGFTPQNDLDYYLQKNCDYKDFKDYKDWKQCMISSIQSYKS